MGQGYVPYQTLYSVVAGGGVSVSGSCGSWFSEVESSVGVLVVSGWFAGCVSSASSDGTDVCSATVVGVGACVVGGVGVGAAGRFSERDGGVDADSSPSMVAIPNGELPSGRISSGRLSVVVSSVEADSSAMLTAAANAATASPTPRRVRAAKVAPNNHFRSGDWVGVNSGRLEPSFRSPLVTAGIRRVAGAWVGAVGGSGSLG